jgi:histidyl-tRNA synthetase
VLGQTERESGKAQLKRMADGQQFPVALSEIAQTVRSAPPA